MQYIKVILHRHPSTEDCDSVCVEGDGVGVVGDDGVMCTWSVVNCFDCKLACFIYIFLFCSI